MSSQTLVAAILRLRGRQFVSIGPVVVEHLVDAAVNGRDAGRALHLVELLQVVFNFANLLHHPEVRNPVRILGGDGHFEGAETA